MHSKNLLRVTAIKQRAQRLGIRKIEAGAAGGKLEFEQQPNIEAIALVKLVQSKPSVYKLAGASALSFKVNSTIAKSALLLSSNCSTP